MKEAEAIEFLRSRVGDEGYVVVGQVPDGTGMNKRRTIDALMVQCWPSRGLSLTAVEYKRTVSDFRRELKQPDKAESIATHCDFMIVLAPKGVVPIGELPPSWGLWEIHKTEKQCRLFRTVAPQALPMERDGVPMSFLVSVLRARENYEPADAKLAQMRRQLQDEFNQRVKDRLKYQTRDHRRLQEKVAEFEEASGLKITNGWGLDRLGEGVAEFLKNPDQFMTRLKQDRTGLARIMEAMDKVIGDEV